MKNITRKFMSGFIILFLCLGIFLYFAQETKAQGEKKSRKILYYRNPMDPAITSPTFMKDYMGMDYIAVYEETEEALGESTQGLAVNPVRSKSPEVIAAPLVRTSNGVKISQSQQQLIGVKTEPIMAKPLMRMIRTVAKIAYDPELYKTEQEFIQAVKIKEELKSNPSPEITERLDALVEAANLKLTLQGLSEQQIEELKGKIEADRSLLISDELSPYVWAYAVLYEYDIGSVNIGDHITLKTIAYPNEEFSGTIKAIDPVLDPNTRSVRIRALIDNPQAKLKPNMYGDIFIHLDLGMQLALPREAILDTGLRKLVYIDLGKGQFKAQEVEVGSEAIAVVEGQERKFFPVLKGLGENDIVVTSGAFLIDSQSQLTGGMSALWGGATEIKQEGESEIKTEHKH